MEQEDRWLTAPSLLARLLVERPSPVQTCLKQNEGSRCPPCKLTLGESRARIEKLGKCINISFTSLLPALIQPKVRGKSCGEFGSKK